LAASSVPAIFHSIKSNQPNKGAAAVSCQLYTTSSTESQKHPAGDGVAGDGGGLRYDDGKLRFDLVPPYAQEQYVRVLTYGANKYKPRNWERGMAWSKVMGSLKRHIHAIEMGELVDPETGLSHAAHGMCNLAFLTEYIKTFPQGNDLPAYAATNSRNESP
jgi:hypothetical protein